MTDSQTYYLVSNSVGPQQVRETEDAYIIEDVPFVRPMELAGGYVPEQSIRETAGAWEGVPGTLNHPRNDKGEPIAANQKPELHIAGVQDTHYDGTHVRGNIHIGKDRLEEVGGEAEEIEQALENGDPIDVSSQYAAAELPPGEYDGEYRENVERIIRPDSVAILPNKTGVCSIEDGCGINPQLAANAAVSIPMTQSSNAKHGEGMDAAADARFDVGDLVRWETSQGSPGTGRVNDVATEPGDTVTAEGADVTREATEDEAAYKLDNWSGDEYETGTVVKSASEIIGEWTDAPEAAMSANADPSVGYDGTADGTLDESAIPNEGFEPHYAFPAETKSESSFPLVGADGDLRRGNVAAAFRFRDDAPDTEALVELLADLNDEFDDPPIEPESLDDAMSANSGLAAWLKSFLGFGVASTANETMGAATDTGSDTPADSDTTDTDSTVNRDELIDDIVSNSALTRNALEARCDEGVQAIHDDVMDAADDDADDTTDDTNTDMTDDPIELDDLSDNAREALVDEAVEQIEANRADEQKEDLVAEIIANSADHDSDDREELLDTPLSVLESLAANTRGGGAGVPGGGATANAQAQTGGDSLDEYPDGTIGGDL